MSNKIFVLNAPSRCGKDTVANYMSKRNLNLMQSSFKFPMYDLFIRTTMMPTKEFFTLYEVDGWKDTPNEGLNGKTPRQLLIHISEVYIKPFFGNDYFGKWVADHIESIEKTKEKELPWVIPDGGFDSEIQALVDKFGDRVVVVRFQREGFRTFDGDSRNWVTKPKAVYLDYDTTEIGSEGLAKELLEMINV